MSSPAPVAAPDPARPPLIALDRASVIRGQVRVLHDLTLRIEAGQHTAVLGANGSGKSTLIKLITRELYPLARADGAPPVQVLGQSRWQVDRLRSQLGIVTGDFGAQLAGMPELAATECDQISIETGQSGLDLEVLDSLPSKTIILGVLDLSTDEVETPETVAARDGWGAMSAVVNGNVIPMDDDVASRWGPRIVDYLEQVGAAVGAAAG